MRIEDWLKDRAVSKSGGNLSAYIKNLIIRDNTIQNKVKRVPLVKRSQDRSL